MADLYQKRTNITCDHISITKHETRFTCLKEKLQKYGERESEREREREREREIL